MADNGEKTQKNLTSQRGVGRVKMFPDGVQTPTDKSSHVSDFLGTGNGSSQLLVDWSIPLRIRSLTLRIASEGKA